MNIRIPFNKPCAVGNGPAYVAQAIGSGHTGGDGPFTRRVEALLQEQFSARRVLLTNSCTSALEMAALLCHLAPGDEVILPSFTFVSTASAVVLRGARPVFVDIRPDTLNIDERLIEAAITPRTRAIFLVHYAGIACEMDAIMAIAGRHGLLVVEDAAQSVFATYKGRWLGTLGHMGCYSFHETKNYSCGEGGALVVADRALDLRAEIIREKGTNRSQFLRSEVDKYTWCDIGSSYAPSDMLAALLLGQLENMEMITARRRVICERYRQRLAPLLTQGVVLGPRGPQHCGSNSHMFYILTSGREECAALIGQLQQKGISAASHYVPLHSSPYAEALALPRRALPVTEDISRRLVRLPVYFDLTDGEVDECSDAVLAFYGQG